MACRATPTSSSIPTSTATIADIVTMKIAHQATPWLTLEQRHARRRPTRAISSTPRSTPANSPSPPNTGDLDQLLLGGIVRPGDADIGGRHRRSRTAHWRSIGGSGPYQQNSWGAQDVATAKADFNIGGFRNIAIAGIDVSYQRADRTIYAYQPADPGAIHLSAGRSHGEPPQYRHLALQSHAYSAARL